MKKVKVLIIDDSALVRQILSEILSSDPQIEVVGTASDPLVGRDKIKQLNPDVLTLDVEMPKMDGITFLSNLMRLRPMPVVMISSLTEAGADITFEALEIGAVDFVPKPKVDVAHGIEQYSDTIIEKVKAASKARVRAKADGVAGKRPAASLERYTADAVLEKSSGKRHFSTTEKIIAIGASTGGTEAIKDVLVGLPADMPGIVITQHIPAQFSAPFAARMNKSCAMQVCEASDGQQILPGHVYIAPGSHHLLVERSGARYVCKLSDGLPVNRHRPSVDVLFRSVAQNAGDNAIGVILTGMGNDGAAGMKEMQEVGAPTVAQDENSSVVWGMPGEAVKLGAADTILPLSKVSEKIIKLTSGA
ncbi:MAG TPA: chemotaxis response regulator protein-glutamate methylesterase [Gammaproteobacteria bacterium]|nr:chemotaxis response regulator protein-glutamate methylesterase [Gammaproteobacteria bacterium]